MEEVIEDDLRWKIVLKMHSIESNTRSYTMDLVLISRGDDAKIGASDWGSVSEGRDFCDGI